MAVKVSKPKVNIREKLTELDIPKGVHGTQLVASSSAAETFELVKAGRKNLLLNGEMRINQRGNVTGVSANQYGGPDRWKTMIAAGGTWSISQDTDVPIGQGFKKSLKMDCTTERSTLHAGTAVSIQQYIEGQDLAHLGWGYPKAKDLTLSFWLKVDNNKTGTFVVYLRNHGGGTVLNRQVRIRSSGYWDKYVVNIPADKTNQFTYDNTKQLELSFYFDAGSNSGQGASGGAITNTWTSYHSAHTAVGCDLRLSDSTSNNLWLTGVQLEEGSEPTPYQHLTFGEELLLCQRYFAFVPSGTVFAGRGNGSDTYIYSYQTPVPMRANPTIGQNNDIAHGSFSIRRYRDDTGVSDSTNTPTDGGSGTYFRSNTCNITFYQSGFTGQDDRSATLFISGGAITLNAEL